MHGLNESNAHELLALALRRWRSIAAFGLLGFLFAAAYAVLAAEWYESRLSVMPSTPSRESAVMAIATDKIPSLDTTSGDSKRIQAVLDSQSVADEVIEKFKLKERYHTTHIEEAREALTKHCKSTLDKKSNVVGLTCEDTDPAIAQAMTAYFGDTGTRVFGRVSSSTAQAEAQFLATQVATARKDVVDTSRALRDFQERHRVVDLPEQAKAVISAMASMKGQLISKQLELSYLRGFAGRDESNVVQLEQQIALLEAKLEQYTAADPPPAPSDAHKGSAAPGEFFPGAMNVPGLRFELEYLIRDQKIKETVYGLLIQRYEMAKVDSARSMGTFQILDHPTLPTLRARPVRRKVALLGGLVGVLIGLARVVIPAWWRHRFTGGLPPVT